MGVGLGLGLVFWVCIRFIKNTVTVKVGFWGYVRVRVMHGADVHDSDFQKGEKCPGGKCTTFQRAAPHRRLISLQHDDSSSAFNDTVTPKPLTPTPTLIQTRTMYTLTLITTTVAL